MKRVSSIFEEGLITTATTGSQVFHSQSYSDPGGGITLVRLGPTPLQPLVGGAWLWGLGDGEDGQYKHGRADVEVEGHVFRELRFQVALPRVCVCVCVLGLLMS